MAHFSYLKISHIAIAIFFAFFVVVTGVFIMIHNNSNSQEKKVNPFAEVSVEYTLLQALVDQGNLKIATFSGGCFWCMEGPFEAEEGVESVISGFTGGILERPTYRQVVGGGTGHRESVQIFYDPAQISFAHLLEIYWRQIDPTDAGGQFADRGDMYTTAIYYHSEKQREEAVRQIEVLNGLGTYQTPIVTEVLPSVDFYPAEDYHQDFYIKSSEYYKKYAKGSGRLDYIEAAEQEYESR